MRIPAFGRAAAVFTGALLPRSPLEKVTFAALTERPIVPVMLPTGRTCQPGVAPKLGSVRLAPTEDERATATGLERQCTAPAEDGKSTVVAERATMNATRLMQKVRSQILGESARDEPSAGPVLRNDA